MRYRFLSDPAQIPALRNFLQIHENPELADYFHESLTPFYLTVMSIRSGKPERNTLTLFSPESSLQIPPLPRPDGGSDNPPLHHHNSYEFVYVIEGSMYQLVEGRRYYYPAGSGCLLDRNTLHAEEDVTDFTCVFLSFTEEFVRRLCCFGHTFLFPEEQELLRNPVFTFFAAGQKENPEELRGFLDFVPKITQRQQEQLIHSLFEQMLRTLIDKGIGATYRLLELLLRLFGALGNEQYYNVTRVTAESNLERLLLSRIDRILDQRHGRISNRELAELLHYSGSYLGRIIKKHTGKSLFDYGMSFAMAYAAELLRSSDQTVASIAGLLHFTNHTHFYRIFQAHYGMTPGEYRKNPCIIG